MKKILLLKLCALFTALLPLQLNAQIITTFAGNNSYAFAGDGGQATAAVLNTPTGVAVDGAGNIYIADQGNSRIRKINTSGIITTYAGNGTAGFSGDGGQATDAKLNLPSAVAIDAAGNLYIADFSNNRIRKVAVSGIITTIAGNGIVGYLGDGAPATVGEMTNPTGVAVDAGGNVYIADKGNNRIRKVNTSGIMTTVAGNGAAGFSGDGSAATNARLHQPKGVAVDVLGNMYIADEINSCVRIVNPTGIIYTFAGKDTAGFSGDGGPATLAKISNPVAVTTDATGNVFLTDQVNYRIREINTSGIINTVAGNGSPGFSGDGGPATAGEIFMAVGTAVDAAGNLYIADQSNNRIRKVTTSGIISTIAGCSLTSIGDGGPATAGQLMKPQDVAFDAAGNVYIADVMDNRIRKVSTSGIITTFAGNGVAAFSGDGGPATAASLNYPNSLAVDGAGNLIITDNLNFRIRVVNTAGIISTYAGTGSYPYNGDGGPATAANMDPVGVAVDGSGNIYISDRANLRIRKVNTSGIISTIAGTGYFGHSADGIPATNAGLDNNLFGIASDVAGNVYIAENGNHKIRKIDIAGTITTVAGNGTGGYGGDGGPATDASLNYPQSISVDAYGNLLICDWNQYVRAVDVSGMISTLAGNGTYGYSGDGGPATAAAFWGAIGARVNSAGNVYVADHGNRVIRKISGPYVLPVVNAKDISTAINIFPNPSTGTLTVSATDKIQKIAITNSLGQTVFFKEYDRQSVNINIAGFPTGLYVVKVNDQFVQRVVKY